MLDNILASIKCFRKQISLKTIFFRFFFFLDKKFGDFGVVERGVVGVSVSCFVKSKKVAKSSQQNSQWKKLTKNPKTNEKDET